MANIVGNNIKFIKTPSKENFLAKPGEYAKDSLVFMQDTKEIYLDGELYSKNLEIGGANLLSLKYSTFEPFTIGGTDYGIFRSIYDSNTPTICNVQFGSEKPVVENSYFGFRCNLRVFGTRVSLPKDKPITISFFANAHSDNTSNRTYNIPFYVFPTAISSRVFPSTIDELKTYLQTEYNMDIDDFKYDLSYDDMYERSNYPMKYNVSITFPVGNPYDFTSVYIMTKAMRARSDFFAGICNFQIEIGNTATAWTPNYADTMSTWEIIN